MSVIGRAWDRRVLPWLVEKACRSTTILAERKRWVPQAAGEVLELGVGSGLNLAFYDPAQARAVVGIDPSPELLVQARSRAEAAAVPVELVEAAAERLPFDADRFVRSILPHFPDLGLNESNYLIRGTQHVLQLQRMVKVVVQGGIGALQIASGRGLAVIGGNANNGEALALVAPGQALQ